MNIDIKELSKHLSNNEANQITRESICLALVSLMDIKDFEKISISELTRRAGVSRQSFYRNYNSKEDIILEIESTIISAFEESLEDPKYENNYRLWLLDLFLFLKENISVVTILNKTRLLDILFTRAPSGIENHVNKHTRGLHYHIIGCLGAIRAIAFEWIESGMMEPAEMMADLCMEFLPVF